MFGISDHDLLDPNKIKVLNGIAGCGKSTSAVSDLRRLNENFILASFSNALKFAASDKFNCPTDTICGLEFVNTPFPRYAEKDVTEYSTVINDEILLDGADCIDWMMNHVGKTNIIALTDSRQMLNPESGADAMIAFRELLDQPYTISVDIKTTKRARDSHTVDVYNRLYNTPSNELFNIKQAAELLDCDIINFDDISFDNNSAYICHSNIIEHEIYKHYDLSSRRDIPLVPKNHIARSRKFDPDKYPICDQMTAVDRSIQSYLQAANVGSAVRFQGREVIVNNECYFLVQSDDVFSGRELYTVGTRCQSISSLHIVVINVNTYKGPTSIYGLPVVEVKRLNIKSHDDSYTNVSPAHMAKIIKENGEADTYYYNDIVTSDDNVIYSTLSNVALSRFAQYSDGHAKLNKKSTARGRSVRSITKKDTSMHFDYMAKVYSIIKSDLTPPRINNPSKCHKTQFTHLCDIYSAFPTMLNFAEMPKAGMIYEQYDPELLNFYKYTGDKVTKNSIITEELANYLGDSTYVFSTAKQTGCELGYYTYAQCKASKDKKAAVNKNFLWGTLESNYYEKVTAVKNGETMKVYVKREKNNLELVACALWSKLCLTMFQAIDSLNINEYFVVVDGLYYSSDRLPTLPEWCDYRVELKDWEDDDKSEKYKNIIFQTYDNPLTATQIKSIKQKEARQKAREELKKIREARK